MTEGELVLKARQGDRDAFAGLVSLHEKKLLALCWNMLGEREEARDAAQETLLQAFQNLERFDPERSFLKWLLGIGAKRCLDRLRRRRTFRRLFQQYALERGPALRQGPAGPSAPAPGGPDEGRTGRLLQRLSPKERATVSLAVFEGFNAREIAELEGCTESTVRVRLFNARLKLRKEVAHGL